MSDESQPKQSLREQRNGIDLDKKREEIMKKIKQDYTEFGKYIVTPAEQRNIILIGRTRVGKSTIKSLLVDPTLVSDDLTLKAGTKDPVFESFHAKDNQFVLNIIDTPGLFERSNNEIDIRDNETILKIIEICINREITKFHVICFCVAITEGINQQDIDSLKLLVNYLGKELSSNACLIITRCESKDEQQRIKMRSELLEDSYFKDIASFFKLGIFFSGTLNPDDYQQANESLLRQFITISDYRTELTDMFVSEIDPFPIDKLVHSETRRILDKEEGKEAELTELRSQLEVQTRMIHELRAAHLKGEKKTKEIVDELLATTQEYETKMKEEQENRKKQDPQSPRCPIS